MFFKFPIRTIVQEEHGGTSLPYNNIQHGMYSLYKVMNRAGANRESLLPYAQVWGIERSGFFNGQGKWAKGFENQMV